MTTPTTFDRVKTVLAILAGGEDLITPTASLRDDLGLDSLDTVEAVIELERELNIRIPDDDAESWLTVEDVVKTVDRLLK